MNYPSIRIEGAILSPDILEHLEDGSKGQGPKDFGLESGSKVKDEIARAWADAQDYWRIFQRKLETTKADSAATTETRQNWIIPLLGLLKYDIEFQKAGTEIHGKNYPISHRVTNRANTPLHIVGFNDAAGLDRKAPNAKTSGHALIQQYLNLADELYGIVTNGRVIRLLRDSSRLVKQSYLEFDLDRIFTDGLFADFAILFRLLHATRLPATADTSAESLLEKYHQDSLDSGARIRDGLSRAVENAIRDFGNGFLAHPANERLRNEIEEGRLTPSEYYRSLLRLIYRLLFLMVIEERDLVFPIGTPKPQRDIYTMYYSVYRLRQLAEKRYLADKRHHDLWMALVSTFRLFEADGPGEKLGIKPLAGDLFSPAAIAPIFDARLGNDVLLGCLRSLGLYEHPDSKQVIRVNYAALNVEEFGSVYEGLLEYEPVFDFSGRFPQFGFVAGDERSRTGSHYTPDELVQPLIKHSLDYLIEDAVKGGNSTGREGASSGDFLKTAEERLLDLRVADIACGSGHILLAAARRVSTELATVRTGEEQPSPPAYRQALRDVIRNCIYGVDVNPLAVELCKVALWLEAHSPGEPLNFLDHHIKCGNAIVGFVNREEVDQGVPEEAFAKMPGDDSDFLKTIRKKNKDERRFNLQRSLNFTTERKGQIDNVLKRWDEIATMRERTPTEIEAKKKAFEKFSTSGELYDLEQIASIPIAQFFIPKTPENRERIITDSEFRDYWTGARRPQSQAFAQANAVAHEKKFFHWFLEFPDIMARGGFDCVLGNPPYLGGTDLSSSYGHSFCSFVKWSYAPAGLSDLVVYFVRRMFRIIREDGFNAFITTNSIKDGAIRKDGLEQILYENGSINFAVRNIKWPGRANLVISLLGVYRGSWAAPRYLDDKRVDSISAYLEESDTDVNPTRLAANRDLVFKGCFYLGDGFLLTHDEAKGYLTADARNSEALSTIINGQELNNLPDQEPGRSIVNFKDWSKEKAQTYVDLFARIESLVKPVRAGDNMKRRREIWWQYGDSAPALYGALEGQSYCFATARTTKYLNFSRCLTNILFSDALSVLATDRWDLYTVVQSTLHEVWARKYSGALKQDLRYSPSNCFETFAFPANIWDEENDTLAQIGESYHEHRKDLMLSLWLGLTKIYNLFHDPELSIEVVQQISGKDADTAHEGYRGLFELRRLHVEMDNAVRDAYGWHDLDLEHGFQEVETLPENDRTRYTISPAARKEVLKRLLALNHARAAEEATRAAAAKPVKKKGGKKSKPDAAIDGDNPLLSAGPLFE